jgi:hypothetical protein
MPSHLNRWNAWLQQVLMLYQGDGASDSKKKKIAIWSKTFDLDDLAIALYLVEVDQMVAKGGVRAMYPASTR